MYEVGSIITTEEIAPVPAAGIGIVKVKTISVVSKVDGDKLYCKYSICSVNGGDWKHTRKVFKEYEGEMVGSVRLVTGSEFDVVVDTGLIRKPALQNVHGMRGWSANV